MPDEIFGADAGAQGDCLCPIDPALPHGQAAAHEEEDVFHGSLQLTTTIIETNHPANTLAYLHTTAILKKHGSEAETLKNRHPP